MLSLEARIKGGIVCGKRLREQAEKKYFENPVICIQCGKVIVPKKHEPVSEVRRKKFCDRSCAGTYNNHKFPKRKSTKPNHVPKRKRGPNRPPLQPKPCSICGVEILSHRKTCSDKCMGEAFRRTRYRQIGLEESEANKLRGLGWEIFSPTVVCDRVGVLDGKVFFIDFKPKGCLDLRPGQRRIHDLMPDNYLIVAHEPQSVYPIG